MPAGVAEYSSTGTRAIYLRDIALRPNLIWAIEVKEEKTQSGLILPDVGDAQKVRIGYCVARGPGEPNGDGGEKPRFVRAGDFFFFGKYMSGGEPIKLGAVEILQFNDNDIAGKWLAPDAVAIASVQAIAEVVSAPKALKAVA